MREDADSLIVAASSDFGSCLQVWELREKALPVHKLLGGSEPQYFNTVVSSSLLPNFVVINIVIIFSYGSINRIFNITTELRLLQIVNYLFRLIFRVDTLWFLSLIIRSIVCTEIH